MLPAALSAARNAGVTRLADITRLDVIGLPVWQAVRPLSRALSVHQGKGWTVADAQVGALLEAVESHAAECFEGDVQKSSWRDLPKDARPPLIADVSADRRAPACELELHSWVAAERLTGQGSLFLPFDLVSLDFTRAVPSPFDRASNGMATGADRTEAVLASLHELIERDAVIEWKVWPMEKRMECALHHASVRADWFDYLADRIVRARASLRCYAVPSLTGTPVFACEINDISKGARPYQATSGYGAHPSKEIALFKAVSEAIQSRAAFIAGARDDLYPWRYPDTRAAIEVAFGLPLPPGLDAVDFQECQNGPATLPELLKALAMAGYGNAAAITLAEPAGLCVVRAFVCGLGSLQRRRRVPL